MADVDRVRNAARSAAAQDDVKERTEAARAAAAEFGKTLLGELQKAIVECLG